MRHFPVAVCGRVALAIGLAAACSPARQLPVVEGQPAAAAGPTSRAATPAVTWTTRLDRDHPLVGRIWSVSEGRFVDESRVLNALRGYVLLGERHDNPDHHMLQARVLRAMVEAGRRPVVAFEMFDADDQPALDSSRREHPRDAASLARAVSWEKSGWPAWTNYAPIAQIALDADLPIVATGLPRSRMQALMKPHDASGDAGAPQPPIAEGVPLTPEQEASLRDELRESHCGHLPEARMGSMIRFQRARDAAMASALIAAAKATHTDDAVLVAGTGHTRRDRGAGRDLAASEPKRPIVSIAFAEVEAGKREPSGYASRWNTTTLPFDFVWFTPRATDDDPCAAYPH